MGAQPAFALNVVAFPRSRPDVPLSALADTLRGAADKAMEAGIFIVGGHTVDDAEPKFGLCVTGLVHPDRIWRNVGAKAGDRLVLTKPLGTGIVTTALRAQQAEPEHVKAAIESMATLNSRAADAGRRVGVRACTDITGFGFLGHLREMLGDGGLGATKPRRCRCYPDSAHWQPPDMFRAAHGEIARLLNADCASTAAFRMTT
jgi:selenide,water dikinase